MRNLIFRGILNIFFASHIKLQNCVDANKKEHTMFVLSKKKYGIWCDTIVSVCFCYVIFSLSLTTRLNFFFFDVMMLDWYFMISLRWRPDWCSWGLWSTVEFKPKYSAYVWEIEDSLYIVVLNKSLWLV